MSDSSPNITANDYYLNPHWDPNAPVVRWRQRMELVIICVINAISLIIMLARIVTQRKRFRRFRKAEYCTLAAAILLVFPLWVCQIMTNHYGSGLHTANAHPSWAIPFWQWSTGWTGYYIVVSLVKISMCYSLLEILPVAFKDFRMLVYGLCIVIFCLGLAESLVWVFQCQPLLSNFDFYVETEWCANIDAARYAWAGISIPIDCILTWIPIAILQRTRLQKHERVVLKCVFGATLLGTAATAVGCYGIWLNREANAKADLTWSETIFILFNDIEIMLYTFGGSLTVLSRYFIDRAAAYYSGGHPNDQTPSSGFSIFSKVSERIRKLSSTPGTHPQRFEEDPYSVNNTDVLAQWHDIEQFELQRPLPPPQEHAMAAMHDPEASKWHTWETSYCVPPASERSHSPSIGCLGVLPDPDSSATTRVPQRRNGPIWTYTDRPVSRDGSVEDNKTSISRSESQHALDQARQTD